MRVLLLLLALASAANFAGCSAQTVEAGSPKVIAANAGKAPVLVELFTSEGCSSCPPAEQALAFLTEQQPVANAEVIALAFHVDYWNGLGWKDVYASPLFTQRQQIYARSLKAYSIYTPQMVVDGYSEFIGSDLGKANKAIAKAVTISKGRAAVLISANKISVTIAGLPNHKDATVYLVVAENGLSTNVGGGENQGRNL